MSLSRFLRTTLMVAAMAGAGCGSDDDDDTGGATERVTLTAAMEVPPPMVMGNPNGTFQHTLDRTTGAMIYTLRVSGLSGPVTGAHIHRAPVGVAGPVVQPLLPAGMTLANDAEHRGTLTLTMMDLADLDAGNLYVNVHTAQNPMGEVRAQLDGK